MAEELSNSSSLYEEIVAINHQVCEKGITPEERNKRYDVICTTYDKIYADTNYKAPFSAAQTVASLYCPEQRSNISVLDIGAGTGRVACELRKVGFNIIDGLEPSQGMLEKAKQKDVYRNLYCMEISDMSLDITKDSYDVITAVGSHGPNHIKSDHEAILEMIRLVKQGGYIIIVCRDELFHKPDFKTFFPLCDTLEKDGQWKLIQKESCSYLPQKEGICLCYQIC